MPKRPKPKDDSGSGDDGGDASGNKAKTPKTDDSGGTSSNAIPIFLKKTYRMIETCDPDICSWTPDGEMFVVKNPELFASKIIPQYFDHNKFSSFARQLNFYGFRKIQTKPIRNEDFDKSTAKFVTFFNEKFKRGRYDLLREIQRSTRGGGAQASLADQAKEMSDLRSTVATLEQRVQDLETRWQDLSLKIEREVQAKVELAVMDLLSSRGAAPASSNLPQAQAAAASTLQQAAQQFAAGMGAASAGMPNLPAPYGADAQSILQRAERSFGSIGARNSSQVWENPLLGPQAARAFSTASASSLGGGAGGQGVGGGGGGDVARSGAAGGGGGATLPPHPKQKSLPPPPSMGNVPQSASGGVGAVNAAGRNLSSATNSSLLLRNAWEDKFFSTLMMTDGASRAASLAGLNGMAGAAGNIAASGNVSSLAALAAAQQMQSQQAALAAQRGLSFGKGSGGAGQASTKGSSLKRQTTAEILLEAAGELGNSSQGKDKEGGGMRGKDEDTIHC